MKIGFVIGYPPDHPEGHESQNLLGRQHACDLSRADRPRGV